MTARHAFGARDWMQLVDQVAELYLGGAPNAVRYRTMVSTGSIVIRWLANHAAPLARGDGPLLDLATLCAPAPCSADPATAPTARDLADACD